MEEKRDEEKKKPVRTAIDLQKFKLNKLFKNIDKPVHLPDAPKARNFSAAPEFVRNVMGSSAGAGSGEFHVYRHIRRREYARQKFIGEQADMDDKDEAYQRKLEENRRLAEERTAKKRAKRQKQRGREKRPKAAPAAQAEEDDSDADSEPEVQPGQTDGAAGPTDGATGPTPDQVQDGPVPDRADCVPSGPDAEVASEQQGEREVAASAAAVKREEGGRAEVKTEDCEMAEVKPEVSEKTED